MLFDEKGIQQKIIRVLNLRYFISKKKKRTYFLGFYLFTKGFSAKVYIFYASFGYLCGK